MAFHIRDDFNGTAGTNLLDRVPNISTTGWAWADPSLGSEGFFWELQLDGVGLVAAVEQPGADGGVGWATLEFPETDSLALKLSMRSADGTSNLNGVSGAMYGALYGTYDTETIDIELFRTFVRCNSPNIPDLPHPTVGVAGAVVEIEIRWGLGEFTVIVNGTTLYSDALPAITGFGNVQFNSAGNNAFGYVDLASITPSEVAPFWTAFRKTFEVP